MGAYPRLSCVENVKKEQLNIIKWNGDIETIDIFIFTLGQTAMPPLQRNASEAESDHIPHHSDVSKIKR